MSETPSIITERDADTAHRRPAEHHAERYAASIPGMLRSMPTPAGTPAEVHAALDALRAALEQTGSSAARADAPDSPALHYGAACASYARILSAFLYDVAPEEPHRAAVLFITYAAASRDQLSAGNVEAAAFLKDADSGTLTPATAGTALHSFPSVSALTAFLGAHHAFSLAVEALADPEASEPRTRLRDVLEVMRRDVHTVTPSRADA